MTHSMCLIGNSHLGCVKMAYDADGETAPYKFFIVPGLDFNLEVKDGVAYSPDRRTARRLRQRGDAEFRLDDFDAFAIVGLRVSLSGIVRIYRSFALWNHKVEEGVVRDGHYLISRPALKSAAMDFLAESPALKIARKIRNNTTKPIFIVGQPCAMETVKELAVVATTHPEKLTVRERRSWGNLRNTLDETIGRDLYEIYKEVASAVAAECGAIFVPQPDDTRTGIFTKAQYRITKEVRDDRHANVDFGRRVLAQMKAEMAAARPYLG